jgi:hypothetical protein
MDLLLVLLVLLLHLLLHLRRPRILLGLLLVVGSAATRSDSQ